MKRHQATAYRAKFLLTWLIRLSTAPVSSILAGFYLVVSLILPVVGYAEIDFTIEPESYDFGGIEVGESDIAVFAFENTGDEELYCYAELSYEYDYRMIIENDCIDNYIEPHHTGYIYVEFAPTEKGELKDYLHITFFDEPYEEAIPFTVPLTGTGIAFPDIDIPPPDFLLDFGSVNVGDYVLESYYFYNWGNDDLYIQASLSNQEDFYIDYYSSWTDPGYPDAPSEGWVDVVFQPLSPGEKPGNLIITSNDPDTPQLEILLQGKGLSPEIAVNPSARNFGTVAVGEAFSQTFIISNIGNVDLDIYDLYLDDEEDFSISSDFCWGKSISPNSSCQVIISFEPQSVGEKRTRLYIESNDFNGDGVTTEVPLSGEGQLNGACLLTPTIQTIRSGDWASPKIYSYSRIWKYFWYYFRIPRFYYDIDRIWGDENGYPIGRTPNSNDIVRINPGHQVEAKFIKPVVKALCNLGTLKKQNGDLNIQVDDISNHGIIRAQGSSAGIKITRNSPQGDTSFYNAKILQAGNGKNRTNIGENGGSIEIYLCQVNNTGKILAGKGGQGRIPSTKGGDGGQVIINSPNLSCYQKEIRSTGMIIGGDGGDGCGGGNGGELRFNSPNTYFEGKKSPTGFIEATAKHHAGKGGHQLSSLCQVGGAGLDGRVYIDPTIILADGASFEGQEITLFGGNDWTLDLSNLTTPLIDTTGDITLAVGENGIIDLTGTQGMALKTTGKIQIYSDHVLLDEGVQLTDVIQANNIVTDSSKILYQVVLTSPEQLMGLPETTISLPLTLINGGPTADTYTLTVNDSKGWTSSQLSSPLTLEGLDLTELSLEITLPANIGEENLITVTATSQADPTVFSSEKVLVVVENPQVYQFYLNDKLQTASASVKPGDTLAFDYVADLTGYNITQDQSEGIQLDNLRIEANQIVKATVAQVEDTSPKTIHLLLTKDEEETTDTQRIYEELEVPSFSLTTTESMSGDPGSTLPVKVTLTNFGFEKNIYVLQVTDENGWTISSLPDPVEVEGQQSVELTIAVNLPTTLEATNVMTITAHAQNYPQIEAMTTVNLIVLANQYSVIGKVVDEFGNPVTGAQVVIEDQITFTNEAGSWKIDNLTTGEYTVTSSQTGYVTAEQQFIISPEQSPSDLTLVLKSLLKLVTFVNPSSACPGNPVTVTIKTIAEESRPFDSIEVYLNFDPTQLQADALLPGEGLDFILQQEIGSDYIHFAAGSLLQTSPIRSSDVLTIHFTALPASSETTLQFNPNFTAATFAGHYLSQVMASDETIFIQDCGNCRVKLQDRTSPPHDSWITDLKIYPSVNPPTEGYYPVTIDDQGYCQLPTELLSNTDSFCVKGSHTLANRISPPFNLPINFGTLLEGDVNNDNRIGLDDYSLLLMSKDLCLGEEGYNPNADLNASGCVDEEDADFLKIPSLGGNLHRPFFPLNDPINASVCQWDTSFSPPTYRKKPQEGSVSLQTTSVPIGLSVGDNFELAIQVKTTQAVDAVAAYLNYDPHLLQVNHLTAGHTLDFILQNEFDNQQGQINFAAGIQNHSPPTDDFTLMTINLTLLGETGEQTLSFNTTEERPTNATFQGQFILSRQIGTVVLPGETIDVTPATCQLYGSYHDVIENSGLVAISPLDKAIQPLGTICQNCNLEALAIHPVTNILYATVSKGSVVSHLYQIDAQTAQPTLLGETGFEETSHLAFDTNGVLWAWAKNMGLAQLNLVTGKGVVVLPSAIQLEDLVWAPNEALFYGVIGRELWSYDPITEEVALVCHSLPQPTTSLKIISETELPESHLLLSVDEYQTLKLYAFDLNTCQGEILEQITWPYDNLKGLTMPTTACQ
jgi:uncharacterized membrane protein